MYTLRPCPTLPPGMELGDGAVVAEAADGTLSKKAGDRFGFSIHGEKACHEPMTCQKSET